MEKEKVEVPEELRKAHEEKLCKKDWEFFRDIQIEWDKNTGKTMTPNILVELLQNLEASLKLTGYSNINVSSIPTGDSSVEIHKLTFYSKNSKRDEYITVVFDFNLGKTLLLPPGVFSV